MLKKITCPVLGVLLLSACGGKSDVDLSEMGSAGARKAAEHFYGILSKGEGKAYVDNMHQAASMDSCKYAQFVDLIDQFIHEEKQVRGGILSASACEDRMVDTVSYVQLEVLFGDSTREEVILPVVYSGGRWWVR